MNIGVLRVSRNKYGTIFTLKGEPWSDGKSASIQASSLVHRLVYTIGNDVTTYYLSDIIAVLFNVALTINIYTTFKVKAIFGVYAIQDCTKIHIILLTLGFCTNQRSN